LEKPEKNLYGFNRMVFAESGFELLDDATDEGIQKEFWDLVPLEI
jgi:hypothetical protein